MWKFLGWKHGPKHLMKALDEALATVVVSGRKNNSKDRRKLKGPILAGWGKKQRQKGGLLHALLPACLLLSLNSITDDDTRFI